MFEDLPKVLCHEVHTTCNESLVDVLCHGGDDGDDDVDGDDGGIMRF